MATIPWRGRRFFSSRIPVPVSGPIEVDSESSVGVGDRFAHQAKAQLEACVHASRAGIEVVPVGNKSNREHNLIGSEPSSTRAAADAAVKALGWTRPYYCDADHINLQTVERFLASCDFYTIDVADFIAKKADIGGMRVVGGKGSSLPSTRSASVAFQKPDAKRRNVLILRCRNQRPA